MSKPWDKRDASFPPPKPTAGADSSELPLSVRDRLLKGSAQVFALKVASTMGRLLVGALIVRLLVPGDAGTYFLAFTLVNLAGTISQLGLNKSVVRLVAEAIAVDRPGRARAAIGMAVRYTVIGGSLVGLLLVLGGGSWLADILSDVHSSALTEVILLVAAWSLTVALYDLLADIFRGFSDIRLATVFEGLAFTGLCVLAFLALWLVRGRASLEEVIALSAGAGAFAVVIAGLKLRPRVLALGAPEPMARGDLLSIAWPLLVTNVIIYALSTASDLWILGAFRPAGEVAAYGAAVRLVGLVQAPALLLAAIVPPLIAAMNIRGERVELQRTLRAASSLALVPSALALLTYLMFGRTILRVLFGGFYSRAWLVLVILSAGQVFGVAAGACGLTLQMTGRQKVMMGITILCGAGSVSTALLLVGPFGAAGVAMATATFLVLQNLLMVLYVRRTLGIWTFAGLSPSVLRGLMRRQA